MDRIKLHTFHIFFRSLMPTPVLQFYLDCLKSQQLLSLNVFAIWFKQNPTFEIGDVEIIHIDADSAFKSAEFISDYEHGVRVTFTVPHHQEMNGI